MKKIAEYLKYPVKAKKHHDKDSRSKVCAHKVAERKRTIVDEHKETIGEEHVEVEQRILRWQFLWSLPWVLLVSLLWVLRLCRSCKVRRLLSALRENGLLMRLRRRVRGCPPGASRRILMSRLLSSMVLWLLIESILKVLMLFIMGRVVMVWECVLIWM